MDYDTTIDDIKNDGTDKWVGKIVVVENPVSDEEINKVCQDKGGDFIDSGECRKYYVKVNNFVDMSQIEFGYVPTDNYPINHIYDDVNKSWTISYQGRNKWFGTHIKPVEEKYNHIFYGKYNLNYSKGWQSNQFCRVQDSCFYSGTIVTDLGNNNYSYYYNLLDYLKQERIQEYSEYFVYISFETSDELSKEYTLKNDEIIDLTLMFGEGNEPDKEWCDKYLTEYYEYNTDGTLVPIKEIGEPMKTSYYDKIDMKYSK